MRRLALLLLIALAGWSLAPRPPSPGKPTPPIDLEARLAGDAVEARASSRTGHEVELEVLLPGGAARRARGRRCELRVDAATPGEILVRATLRDGAATITRVVSLGAKGGPPAPKGALRANSRGEAILEFGP